MPSAEWYLQIKQNDQDGVNVQIDPATVFGRKGLFGRILCLPYTLSPLGGSSRVTLRLLSFEGWIGWGNEQDFVGRIRIPSQIISNNPNKSCLQVPITDVQIEAIEDARKGSNASFTVSFAGLATVTPSSTDANILATLQAEGVGNFMPIESSHPSSLSIERERWLIVLQDLGAGTRRLVELPEPHLPRGVPQWNECLRLLDGAIQLHRSGDYEHALVNCRQIVEGIPHVLCAVWGLRQKRSDQSFEGWVHEMENRLSSAWQNDHLTPKMLRTMLTGTWHWSVSAPHYGTGIPLREEVSFALGLCTDLLHFAGQVLQAHPHSITGTP